MRSNPRPAHNRYWRNQWHDWFVWYPKKVYLGPYMRDQRYNRPYQWVWWEYIERRKNPSTYQPNGQEDPERDPTVETDKYQYRIKPQVRTPAHLMTETTGEEESNNAV